MAPNTSLTLSEQHYLTLFVGHRFSKHKTTRYARIFRGLPPLRLCIQLCGQGRNEGGKGAQLPGRQLLWGCRITAGGPNHCGGRRKVPTMSQIFSSIHYICFRNITGSNMGAKPASCPGRHLTSLRPCVYE